MKPYIPTPLPLKFLSWDRLIRSIGQANAALARYDGILQHIINPEVLLSPLTTQEAVLSSKIEGSQATLEEVLDYEATKKFDAGKGNDIHEIVNYRVAIQMAVDDLGNRPISLNLIRSLHNVLLDSVRGQDKGRGQFRKRQNYIGRPGDPIERAIFIPPEQENLLAHLYNFESYIHYEEKDRLVQLAIIHAQFELIHPFIDGNGRVGRMLIPLFLFEKKMLSSPMFYISGYLEAHRDVYYDKLKAISQKGDWVDWIIFFLGGIVEQAKTNGQKAKAILDLYEEMKREIALLTRSQFSMQALDTLFNHPLFSTSEFIVQSKIPKASAMRILAALRKKNILIAIRESSGSRPALLIFTKLLKIVNK